MTDLPGSDPGMPEATDEAVRSWTDQPDSRPADPVELWTPKGIGVASVLLGFPGALVTSALNWRRMGRTRKAVVHLVAAVIGTWALMFTSVGSAGLGIGLVVGYYLYRAQRGDQSALIAAGRVTERSGLAGAVITIGATILIVASGAVVAAAVGAGGIDHRGEILFGTRAGADVCSVAGQTTVFGPDDPIFLAAVMRETVQTGSHVVFEMDGPGRDAGAGPGNRPTAVRLPRLDWIHRALRSRHLHRPLPLRRSSRDSRPGEWNVHDGGRPRCFARFIAGIEPGLQAELVRGGKLDGWSLPRPGRGLPAAPGAGDRGRAPGVRQGTPARTVVGPRSMLA